MDFDIENNCQNQTPRQLGYIQTVPPLPLVSCLFADRIVPAYFNDSLEALYGIVHRPEFEARLTEHFNGTRGDDSSWYALRNVVYATGCRTYLSTQKSQSWTDVQQRSWAYLENAMSVYFDLLYTPTGLSAVRALAAMVGIDGLFHSFA